jgi:hypothetical protein
MAKIVGSMLGSAEDLFDKLIAADQEFGRAIVALGEEVDVERYLPRKEREYLARVLRAYVRLERAIIDLIDPMRTEPGQNFWKGFAVALETVGREDLLAEYPYAADAAKLVEAERILANATQPPPVT